MAEIVKDDDLNLDDIDDELDNDESYDLDGDSDEDIDTDLDDEETDDAEADDGEDELDETETDENNDETDDESDEGNSDEDGSADESAADEKDKEIAELRKQVAARDATISNIRNLSKETLQKMGVQVDGSVEEALEKANAESEGVSLEEYRKARAQTAEAQAAERQAKQQAFEELAARDLSELKKSFPDLLKTNHITDCFDNMADFIQFGKLRDSGVEPKTAYLAVNGDKVRTKQATAAQLKATNGGKEHLNSAVSKKASGNNTVIPKEELQQFRDMFPNLSDKELRALYKQTL